MIDHVSVAVLDLEASGAFYDHVLEPLGAKRMVERAHTIGFGRRYPAFWLNARAGIARVASDTGNHVCLRAPSIAAVRLFHERALNRGGCCDGPPGERQASMTAYFGAFVRDLDGNKIEAATFPKAP